MKYNLKYVISGAVKVIQSVGGVAVFITAFSVIMSFFYPALTQWAMFAAALMVAIFTPAKPAKYIAKVKWLSFVLLVIALSATHLLDVHLVEVRYPELDGLGCFLLIYAIVNLLLHIILLGWLKCVRR